MARAMVVGRKSVIASSGISNVVGGKSESAMA